MRCARTRSRRPGGTVERVVSEGRPPMALLSGLVSALVELAADRRLGAADGAPARAG